MTFENLNKLHEYLNQNGSEISSTDDIAEIIKSSIDELVEGDERIEKFELERAVLSFRIEEFDLKPKFTFRNKEGHLVSYPSIHVFTKDHFDYLEEVFESSSSNIIKAQYGHFLWLNGKKHTKYLDETISGYYEYINNLLDRNKENIDESKRNTNYYTVNHLLYQLVFLCQRRKNIEVARELILSIVGDSNHEFLFYSIALLMLETKKVFRTEDYDLLIPKCLTYAQKLESPFERISYFELGRKIDHRQNSKSENWLLLIAKEYEDLAVQREDMAAITFANKAIRYYEQVGDYEASERMAKLYKEKSDTKVLTKVQSEVEITDYVKFIDEIIEDVIKRNINEVVLFLCESRQVIPQKSLLDDMASSVKRNNTIRYYVSNYIYDSNGHIAQHFNTEEEVSYMLVLENYNQILKVRFEVLVNRLFIRLIKRDDWNAEKLLNILDKESWYGQEIYKPLNSEDSISLKIVDLIRPGIVNYFNELNRYEKDNDYQPDFMLSIDSLSLKVERILRELCILIGVRTFYIRRDNYDREVTKEKDLNMLLREEKLIEFLGEDFVLYLKSLFIERIGSNLRNKVAHAFIYPVEYQNFSTVNKVIVALLKLSTWKISGIKDEEE